MIKMNMATGAGGCKQRPTEQAQKKTVPVKKTK